MAGAGGVDGDHSWDRDEVRGIAFVEQADTWNTCNDHLTVAMVILVVQRYLQVHKAFSYEPGQPTQHPEFETHPHQNTNLWSSSSKYPDLVAAATPDDRGKKRQPSDVTPGGGPSAKRQQGAQQGGSTSNNLDTKKAKTFCPILQREVQAYWGLGPKVSTEEAVKHFASLFRSSPANH